MDVDTTFAGPDNRYVTEYEIQDGVTTIAKKAFWHCYLLTSVKIPKSVTTIAEDAFKSCKNLTSVNIPKSVTTIGLAAFSDCNSLKSVEIPDSVLSIGDFAFDFCTSFKSVVIPGSVTTIGKSAFEQCVNLESVVIPHSVTEISYSMFNGCASLKSVVIPNSVTIIHGSAFEGCKRLKSVVIPNSVTKIDYRAFAKSGLESIVIPNSVQSIDADTFESCPYLSVIEWRGSTKNKGVKVGPKDLYFGQHGTTDPLTLTCPKNATFVVDDINEQSEQELNQAYKEALLAAKGPREDVIAALEGAANIFNTDPSDETIEKAEKKIDNAKTTLKKAENDVHKATENYRIYLKQSREQLTLEEYARRANINLETRKTWNEKAFVATASLYRSLEIKPKESKQKELKRKNPGKERVEPPQEMEPDKEQVKLPQEMILGIMELVNPALKRARRVQPPP